MGQYTSYYLYQKFEKRDGQDFIPVYPNTYSVDADGTMPKVVKNENDENCGYTPPAPDPIYRWVQITPTSDPSTYVCDECQITPIYRWVQIIPTSDPSTYVCDECQIVPIYRWANSGTTCVGYDKYQRGIKQVSYDNGSTWDNVIPTEYSATTLIEANSEDCGYIPSNLKLYATYSDSTTYTVDCNSSTTLSQTEVRGHSTPYSSMTSAEIGDCVRMIGGLAFLNCSGLTSIEIPDSVTSIGANAFADCTSLTSCTIGSGVTSIDVGAFDGCSSLTSITVNATTPPTLGDIAFRYTNNCPIFVPCESVDTYKVAAYWSLYASRIQGIEPCYSYSAQYFTFETIDSGTFTTPQNVYYSLDSGATWTYLAANATTPTVQAGNKIMWKQTGNSFNSPFTSTCRFNVEGNIMSLLYGDNFQNQTSLSGKEYAFADLFYNNARLFSAENLVLPATTLSIWCYANMFYGCNNLSKVPTDLLPATTLANDCYREMFNGCTWLTTAPQLPATNLAIGCYYQMFYGCSRLNYIKCLATDISAPGGKVNWVSGVASTGTFVKASSMSGWPSGVSGIPSGWTIQNA